VSKAFFVWLVLIFIVSLYPEPPHPPGEFKFMDKIEHFYVYAVLGVLYVAWRRKPDFKAFLLIAGIGMLNEILQGFIPGRDMSLGDFLANAAGGGFSIWMLR